jgi:Cu(I)/Ag(I) efflux system membrane fusion protein
VETVQFARELPAVGNVAADERRIVQVQSRLAGFLERLTVRAVNDPVRAGQLLAEIYSPEWFGAQQEFLFAQKLARADAADEPLARAARQRLLLFGLSESEVAKIELAGVAQRHFPLIAPTGGVLSELPVREGQSVSVGMPMFTISDLSSVWITVEVPERQAGVLREGVRVKASVATLPGKDFEGRIDYLYPQVNTQTRTLKARATLANPRLELKPGMLVEVRLATPARRVLAVPSEAVIQTGTRTLVIVAEGERFRPVTVQTGLEMDGRTEVLKGLKEGERVVASGQFLIDSESSLRTTLARLDEAAVAPPPAAPGMHKGFGRVTSVTPAKGQLELAHEPIPSMRWPAMEMGFVVEDKRLLQGVKRGDAVEFEMRGEPDKAGEYVILRIAPRAGASPAPHGSHK